MGRAQTLPAPRCPALIQVASESGYCDEHRAEHHKDYEQARDTSTKRGYGRRHQKWRRKVLARDPICVACPRGCSCLNPSTVADHIVPIKQGGARFSLRNGQGLCAGCHNRKTKEEQRAG